MGSHAIFETTHRIRCSWCRREVDDNRPEVMATDAGLYCDDLCLQLSVTHCHHCEDRCDRLNAETMCCECRDFGSPSSWCNHCDNRATCKAEAAYERRVSDYYGGEIVTLTEQMDAARRLK